MRSVDFFNLFYSGSLLIFKTHAAVAAAVSISLRKTTASAPDDDRTGDTTRVQFLLLYAYIVFLYFSFYSIRIRPDTIGVASWKNIYSCVTGTVHKAIFPPS